MSRGQLLGTRGPNRAWIPAVVAGLWLLLGSSMALATESGAESQVSTARSWENYFGVTILPSNRIVVVGDKGIVMTSDDQGHTWTRRQLKKGDKYYDLYSVAFAADGSAGWVVGDGGAVYRSTDMGKTWTEQKSGTSSALLKVAVIDNQKACAVGEHGAVVCTADGGSTWNAQTVKDLVYFDVVFTDANDGWAVGEFGTTIHSADAGKTWTVKSGAQRLSTADPYFTVAFGGNTDGLVLGLDGANMATTNGGQSWQTSQFPNWHDSFFTAVPLPSGGADNFYAAGENGAAARIDHGKVSPVNSGTSNAITALAFTPHVGLAVGLGGTILRSDDSGNTWRELDEDHITEARGQ
jgi:photosystem II stability/assembly factor-like uncharacterized protein